MTFSFLDRTWFGYIKFWLFCWRWWSWTRRWFDWLGQRIL